MGLSASEPCGDQPVNVPPMLLSPSSSLLLLGPIPKTLLHGSGEFGLSQGNKECSKIFSLSSKSLSVLRLGSLVEHLITLEVILLVKAKMGDSGKTGAAGEREGQGWCEWIHLIGRDPRGVCVGREGGQRKRQRCQRGERESWVRVI